MAKTSCRKSSKASNSKTASRSSKCRLTTPPDRPRHPISRIALSPCGCIVTDVLMPDITGIDLLKRLIELNVNIPVIVITGVGDVPLAVEAMKLGAADFFEKPFDGDVVVAAVRRALAGSVRDAVREAEKVTMQNRIASLSLREREVLAGLAAGHPNKTIAYDLGISQRAVEVY